MLIAGLLQISQSWAATAAAPTLGVISFAEKPARIIRATTLYGVTAGTRLQAGDILQSGASVLQIEGLPAATVALGPDTRVLLARDGNRTEISLLSGWLKLQPAADPSHNGLAINAGTVVFTVTNSASVIHAGNRRIELFVEDGTQSVSERDGHGHTGNSLSLSRETYAVQNTDDALKSVGRPPETFVNALPRPFLDPLVPQAKKSGNSPALKKEREVTFDDIAPWLSGPLNLNQNQLANRFGPRLNDATFRQDIKTHLGGRLDWELELFRFEQRKRLH
nr:hypothetical protein [Pseudomonas gingeri]